MLILPAVVSARPYTSCNSYKTVISSASTSLYNLSSSGVLTTVCPAL